MLISFKNCYRRKKKCVREGGEDIDSDSSEDELAYSQSLPSIRSPKEKDAGFSLSAPTTPIRTPPLSIGSPSFSSHTQSPFSINHFLQMPPSPAALTQPIAIPGVMRSVMSPKSPVGCDPRDENNPLSVTQLTSSPQKRDKNQIM